MRHPSSHAVHHRLTPAEVSLLGYLFRHATSDSFKCNPQEKSFLLPSRDPSQTRKFQSPQLKQWRIISATGDNTMTPSTEPVESLVLSLPKELLIYIIELAVVETSGCIWCRVKYERSVGTELRTKPSSPALAHTCSLLEAIVLPIYYGQNRFAFRSPGDAADGLHLRLGRKDGLIVHRVIIFQFHKREAALEASLNKDTGISVTFMRDHVLMQSPAALKERPSMWVEEINDTSKRLRRREDMIRDFCFCLSLYLGLDPRNPAASE